VGAKDKVIINLVQSFLPSVAVVDPLSCIWKFKNSKHSSQSIAVERFVINDEYFFLVEDPSWVAVNEVVVALFQLLLLYLAVYHLEVGQILHRLFSRELVANPADSVNLE